MDLLKPKTDDSHEEREYNEKRCDLAFGKGTDSDDFLALGGYVRSQKLFAEKGGALDLQNNTKMRWLRKHLRKFYEAGHKVLVFSQYTRILDVIQSMVEGESWGYQRLDGSTPSGQRASRSWDGLCSGS